MGGSKSEFIVPCLQDASGYVVGDSAEDHDVVTPSSYVIKKQGCSGERDQEECRVFMEHYCDGARIAVLQEADEGQSSTPTTPILGIRKAALRGVTLHENAHGRYE